MYGLPPTVERSTSIGIIGGFPDLVNPYFPYAIGVPKGTP